IVSGTRDLVLKWGSSKEHYAHQVWIFFLLGVVYMLIKGAWKTIRYKPELQAKLREHMKQWDEREKSYTSSYPKDWDEQRILRHQAEKREAEKSEYIKREKIDVSKHVGDLATWCILWPFDLGWNLLFRWFSHLKAIFQWFADRTIRGIEKGI